MHPILQQAFARSVMSGSLLAIINFHLDFSTKQS